MLVTIQHAHFLLLCTVVCTLSSAVIRQLVLKSCLPEGRRLRGEAIGMPFRARCFSRCRLSLPPHVHAGPKHLIHKQQLARHDGCTAAGDAGTQGMKCRQPGATNPWPSALPTGTGPSHLACRTSGTGSTPMHSMHGRQGAPPLQYLPLHHIIVQHTPKMRVGRLASGNIQPHAPAPLSLLLQATSVPPAGRQL